jgi:fatty acid/phospholipid biosynthesis enzyme
VKFAVDAMGGDKAPEAIVQGAIEAVELDPAREIILVGQETVGPGLWAT